MANPVRTNQVDVNDLGFLSQTFIMDLLPVFLSGYKIMGIQPYAFNSLLLASGQYSKPFGGNFSTVVFIGFLNSVNKPVFAGVTLAAPLGGNIILFDNLDDGVTPVASSYNTNPTTFYGVVINCVKPPALIPNTAPPTPQTVSWSGGADAMALYKSAFTAIGTLSNKWTVSTGSVSNTSGVTTDYAAGQSIDVTLLDNSNTSNALYIVIPDAGNVSGTERYVTNISNLSAFVWLADLRIGSCTEAAFDQVITALPSLVNLSTLWLLNCSPYTGHTLSLPNAPIVNFILSFFDTQFTISSIPSAMKAVCASIQVQGCPLLTSFPRVLGCVALLQCYVHSSGLGTAVVNQILEDLDANGLTGGSVYLKQNVAAPPSGGGITAAANLVAKGWSVTTD